MQPQLAQDVAAALRPGGRLVVQSDVREVALHIHQVLLEAAGQSLRLAPEHMREQQLGGGSGSAGAGAAGEGEQQEQQQQQEQQEQQEQQQQGQQEQGGGISWSLLGGAADVPGPAVSYPGGDAPCLLPWLQCSSVDGAAGAGRAAGGRAMPQWLATTPLGVPTERELYVRRGRRPIWRFVLVRS
jgi:hypothetical protein